MTSQPGVPTLSVASVSLQQLLAGEEMLDSAGLRIDGQLQLPEYQRPYRWEAAQVAQLAQDLWMHRTSGAAHDYYLGSLILHHSAQGALNIIDGQQRITSMGILCVLAQLPMVSGVRYSAPESRERIRSVLLSLPQLLQGEWLQNLDLARIHVTLVVTRSEDDAYRFFETQNSGGVRLSGIDIAKAHHLRAVPVTQQDAYARRWEGLAQIAALVDSVMRVRHWDDFDWRSLCSEQFDQKNLRAQVIAELAERTADDGGDTAYPWQVLHAKPANGEDAVWAVGACAPTRYALRQPLQAGCNSIHYLEQLHALQAQVCPEIPRTKRSQAQHQLLLSTPWLRLYDALVLQSEASLFLRKLMDAALLLYVSRFGDQQLLEAGLWLHRLVYALRVRNKKMVREESVQKFAKETRVLDWIASCYTHAQLVVRLQLFEVEVDAENFDAGYKKRLHVQAVMAALGHELGDDADWGQVAQWYDPLLQQAMRQKLSAPAAMPSNYPEKEVVCNV